MTGRAGQCALTGGLLAALVAGCIRGTLPPRELYRLVPADSAATARMTERVRGTPALEGTLAVAPYATPGLYGNPQIVYRVGAAQYGTYPSREWAMPLSIMLAARTAEALRGASFALGSVVAAPARRNTHEYEWRGAVREFEEVNRGKQLFAAVHLDGSVVRAGDDSVLWRGSTRLERHVDVPTMEAIVGALSALTDSAVVDLAQQAARALRTGATAAAPRRSQPR